MLNDLTKEEVKSRIDKVLDSFYMSPSAMKKLDSCQAYYVLERVLLPKIEPGEKKHLANLGRKFHTIAENDFDTSTANEQLSDDTGKVKTAVDNMTANVKGRSYYSYDSEKEKELRHPLKKFGDVFGIVDRFIPLDDSKCIIVDYKTTSYINTDNEIRQMLTYAWLAWKKLKYKPEDITVILDYVSEPEPFEYRFTEYDLMVHENYMISRFRLAKTLLEEFRDNMDLRKLIYSPGGGSCTFCSLCGSCLAYQVWYNPGISTDDVSTMSTTDLIKEKLKLDEITKIFDERLKTVNRTLMFRSEVAQTEPGDIEGRHPSDIISKYMSKVTSQIEEYDTKMVIDKVVSGKTKKMVKKLGLIENVDLQQLNSNIIDIMMEYLPARLDKGKVPADVMKDLYKSRMYKPRAPYFKYKK